VNRIAALEHPLTIAEIFDRAVVLCVRRWRVAIVLSVAVAVPGTLARALAGRLPSSGAVSWGSFLIALPVVAFFGAALVRAFGDPDAPDGIGELLRGAARDYRRALPSYLLVTVLFYGGTALAASAVASAYASGLGAGGGPMGAVLAAVVGVPVVAVSVPLSAVLMIAYPTTVLERVGAWRGLRLAFARVRSGAIARAWLLGAVLLAVWLGPTILVDSSLDRLGALPGLWWLQLLQPVASVLAGWCYSLAAAVVAATDFRLRREGTDLQTALEQVSST
jgi:hypothetical protein